MTTATCRYIQGGLPAAMNAADACKVTASHAVSQDAPQILDEYLASHTAHTVVEQPGHHGWTTEEVSPPVTKTEMPTLAAINIVADTVVAPSFS